MDKLKKYKEQICLGAIVAMSVLFNFLNLRIEGYSNQYYAAGVKSMTLSLKNFFFAALDPAGFVTLDKPPLGYWMQAISVKIFGFSGWSILVPQALAGVLSVILIYIIVKKSFGEAAGLLSALFLSVTPVFIAVSRNNTVDNQVVFALLLACWALLAAVREGKFRYLAVCMVMIGIGFNIKMLQAYMILPAIFIVYLFSNKISIPKRVLHLFAGTIILLAVSLSWALIVDSISPDSRPYIGSSSDNTVMSLITGHNGAERLNFGNLLNIFSKNKNQGQSGQGWDGRDGSGVRGQLPGQGLDGQDGFGMGGQVPGQVPGQGLDGQNGTGNVGGLDGRAGNRQDGGISGIRDGNDGSVPDFNGGMPGFGGGQGSGFGAGGPGGGPGFGGSGGLTGTFGNQTPAGFTRLFLKNVLSDQIVWFIPLALFGFIAGAIREKLRIKLDTARKQSLVLWFMWFLPEFIYFSFNTGLFHSYYLTMLAPPIAAMAGIGIVSTWNMYKAGGWKSWFLPLALLANGMVQMLMLSYFRQSSKIVVILTGVLIALCFISVIMLSVLNLVKGSGLKIKTAFIGCAVAGLLVTPAAGSAAAMFVAVNPSLPGAGLELLPSNLNTGTSQTFTRDGNWDSRLGNGSQIGGTADLVNFLNNHKVNGKSQIVVASANTAESLTLNTDLYVGSLSGFMGNEQVMSLDQFKQKVANGEIRYVLADSFGMGFGRGGSGNEIITWVKENGKQVTYASGDSSDNPGMSGSEQLYDLAGTVE
jgi:4-amino-4-deoxy-L-arabinose transferase-like glycosyltransferase